MAINMTRRSFLAGATATAAVAGTAKAMMAPTVDDSLSVFLSDLHVRDPQCHQYRYFAAIVDEILSLNPRPKHVVVFGDIAYTCGLKPEYETSRPLFRKLIDAGMDITFGMGNHDRRAAFLSVWPGYKNRILLPGKIVSRADLGSVDLLMLDGLQGTDDRADDDMGPVDGKLDKAQEDWLYAYLKGLKKPTILASHYPLADMRGTEKRSFADHFRDYPLLCGYIYGHLHRWDPYWTKHGWGMSKLLRNVCLPSTGHWGDIGYVLFRAEAHKGTATFVQKDFFFSEPAKDGEMRPQEWDDILSDRSRDLVCTFRW